jgi:hypothetical protein
MGKERVRGWEERSEALTDLAVIRLAFRDPFMRQWAAVPGDLMILTRDGVGRLMTRWTSGN